MKQILLTVLLFLLLRSIPAAADDVEAYLYGGAIHGVFVQVVMDLGDSDVDATLCTYGVDCGPPFMTLEAYHHLGEMYSEGESVTAPGIFKAVLAAVVENALLDDMHFALLISNHQDNPSGDPVSGIGGGTILQGYRHLAGHRAEFIATLKATPILSSAKSHVLQPKETWFEWLRYLRGDDVALGQNTHGNFGGSGQEPGYDHAIIAGGKYLTPFSGQLTCPKLYSILFTQGAPSRDDDLDDEIAAQLPPLNQPSFTQLLSYLHEGSTDLLPQVEASVPVQKTWVVTSRERPGRAAEYAVAGNSETPLYVNAPVALQANLTRALVERVAVAGSSLDAGFANDSFNQEYPVFIPQFLPQSHANWPGNLKKLKLSIAGGDDPDSGEGLFDQVVDARGALAYELSGDQKGQLRFDALTFWTDVATLSRGNGAQIPDDADGPVVARGGAGQKIDGFARYSVAQGELSQHFIGDTNTDTPIDGYGPRQLFYEPESGRNLVPFDANATTVSALSSLLDPDNTRTDELELIKWARGQDIDSGKSSARAWIMGGVMHSRPLALNYGATPGYSTENPNVHVLFGSWDGAFHIVENTDSSGRESGRELFGFYPRESLAAIGWRHDETGTGIPRHYGVDGAPAVLRVDLNADGKLDAAAGDEAYVYFGLRRGGAAYFALDVSKPNAVPALQWKIRRTTDGLFDELGLTFSTPVVGKVNYSGVPLDVLIFAGGYDGGWNTDYTARRGKDLNADDDTVGNAIFIVNARTGELVWKAVKGMTGASSNTRYQHAGLVDSIPSTVSALVTSAGIVHRLYVGDSGGAIWRVDLPPARSGNSNPNYRRDHWFITKLADLGSDAAESGGTAHDDRRFFHAPDIVQSYDALGKFDGVVIPSGNRADPNEILVENALFYIKDREIVTGSATVRAENDVSRPHGRYQIADLPDQTNCVDDSDEVMTGEDCADRSVKSGWQFRFQQPGEKGLSTPLTDGGRIIVSTYTPPPMTPCSNERGQGRLYVLRLRDAATTTNYVQHYKLGEGIPAAAVPVGNTIFLPGGGIELSDLDGDGERDASQFLPSLARRIYRTYWREPGIDPL